MRQLLMVMAWAVAGAAAALDYNAAPSVTAAAEGADGAVLRAAMDVAAPPQAVYAALVDCPRAHLFMPGLLSCRVLERDPAGRWEVREHRLRGRGLKPVLLNVFRIDLEPPARLAFRRVAGDWKRSEGEWRIQPLEGGLGARVTYETHMALAGPVPRAMVRAAIAQAMPKSLLALRREVLARTQPAVRR